MLPVPEMESDLLPSQLETIFPLAIVIIITLSIAYRRDVFATTASPPKFYGHRTTRRVVARTREGAGGLGERGWQL